jgi:flagellar FliL protein
MAEAAAPAPQAPAPSGGNNKMMFIVIGAMFFLLVAGMGGMFFVLQGKSAAKETPAAEPVKGKKEPAKNKGTALYVSFEPPFVVNFAADSPVRFLQVSLQVMTRDAAMEHLMKENDPAVRNGILTLLSMQKYEDLATAEGKETLRTKALDSVRAVIKEEGGEANKIEAVYFTSFVMQ